MTPEDIKVFRDIRDRLQESMDIATPVMDAIASSERRGGSLDFNAARLDGPYGIRTQIFPKLEPLINAEPTLILAAFRTFDEADIVKLVDVISNDDRFINHKSFYAALLMYAQPDLSKDEAIAKANMALPMEMRSASFVLTAIAERVYGTDPAP
jgi:hypothetical protein